MIMVCCSMAELFVHYKVIWIGFKAAGRQISASLHEMLQKRGKHSAFLARRAEAQRKADEDLIEDPAPASEQVPTIFWVS